MTDYKFRIHVLRNEFYSFLGSFKVPIEIRVDSKCVHQGFESSFNDRMEWAISEDTIRNKIYNQIESRHGYDSEEANSMFGFEAIKCKIPDFTVNVTYPNYNYDIEYSCPSAMFPPNISTDTNYQMYSFTMPITFEIMYEHDCDVSSRKEKYEVVFEEVMCYIPTWDDMIFRTHNRRASQGLSKSLSFTEQVNDIRKNNRRGL